MLKEADRRKPMAIRMNQCLAYPKDPIYDLTFLVRHQKGHSRLVETLAINGHELDLIRFQMLNRLGDVRSDTYLVIAPRETHKHPVFLDKHCYPYETENVNIIRPCFAIRSYCETGQPHGYNMEEKAIASLGLNLRHKDIDLAVKELVPIDCKIPFITRDIGYEVNKITVKNINS